MSRQNAADALKWLWNRCTASKAQNASTGTAEALREPVVFTTQDGRWRCTVYSQQHIECERVEGK